MQLAQPSSRNPLLASGSVAGIHGGSPQGSYPSPLPGYALENSRDLVCIKNRNGQYIYINSAGLQILERSHDQVLGATDTQLFGEEGLPLWSNDREVLVNEQSLAFLEKVSLPERILRFFSWKTPFRDPEGKVVGILGILREMDEEAIRSSQSKHKTFPIQKESAGEVEHRLNFLLSASRVLSSSLDYETTLQNVAHLAVPQIAEWCAVDVLDEDQNLCRLAVAHADPQKVSLAIRLHEQFARRPGDPVLQVVQTGRALCVPSIPDELLRSLAHDQNHYDILRSLELRSFMVLPLLARGRTLGAITLVTGVTHSPFQESDLTFGLDLASRAAVAVDNAMLYRALKKARETAEAAGKAKDDFLAVLSHELRTPLTPVLMTISLLRSMGGLPEKVYSKLKLMERNVQLEARLIDDLLDLNRFARGKVEMVYGPVDLHAILIRSIEFCRAALDQKKLDLQLFLEAPSSGIRGDSDRLQQVFWNLLNNAIKFTPEGGKIEIKTHLQNGSLQVEIADTGMGISPELLPRIFNPFEQGGMGVTARFGGLGLGLAISKAVVEAHGGVLTADSAGVDKGAVFRITFPEFS